jgi:hypothetical protein
MYHEATIFFWTTVVLFYSLKKLLLLEGVLDLPDFQEFGSRTEMLEKKKTLSCVICCFEKRFLGHLLYLIAIKIAYNINLIFTKKIKPFVQGDFNKFLQ